MSHLVTKCSVRHHRRRWIIAGIDVHQWHPGHLIGSWSVRWRRYSVHDRRWLDRCLSRWVICGNHVNWWLIRIIAWCRCHGGHGIIGNWIAAHIIGIRLTRRSHSLRVKRIIRRESLLLMQLLPIGWTLTDRKRCTRWRYKVHRLLRRH